MAVALATRAKCAIQPPPWMDPPELEETLRRERESEAEFQARPARERGDAGALNTTPAAACCARLRSQRVAACAARALRFRACPPRLRSIASSAHARCRMPTARGAHALMLPSAAAQPLPFHYIEISTALFKHAGDVFGERRQRVYDLVENIRRRASRLLRVRPDGLQGVCSFAPLTRFTYLCCRRSVRFNKIERGLRRLDGASAAYIRLNNVSAMEARERRDSTADAIALHTGISALTRTLLVCWHPRR
jgi:hypothetical protein